MIQKTARSSKPRDYIRLNQDLIMECCAIYATNSRTFNNHWKLGFNCKVKELLYISFSSIEFVPLSNYEVASCI